LQWQIEEDIDGSDKLFSNPYNLEPNEELWQPEGASYYNGELIVQPRFTRWTPQEQLELLDTHPLFTDRCPQYSSPFPQYNGATFKSSAGADRRYDIQESMRLERR
jgi:hypothetical protein